MDSKLNLYLNREERPRGASACRATSRLFNGQTGETRSLTCSVEPHFRFQHRVQQPALPPVLPPAPGQLRLVHREGSASITPKMWPAAAARLSVTAARNMSAVVDMVRATRLELQTLQKTLPCFESGNAAVTLPARVFQNKTTSSLTLTDTELFKNFYYSDIFFNH
ncbi:hypothetical protein EYF80_048988 [Liparis tanakae]|uniref:Uncharacterized protein n=1 Tax=Liparis tanakae TaxID=230148 RepID=A0A4Z2FJA3_9TELE|nr:hypothetical protein EYF80_048988 [Liparis tanakae]